MMQLSSGLSSLVAPQLVHTNSDLSGKSAKLLATAQIQKVHSTTPAAEPAAAPKRTSEQPRAWRDIASAPVKAADSESVVDQKKTDTEASNGEEAKKSNDGWSEVRSDKKNRKSNNTSGGSGGGGGEKRRERRKIESN